MNLRRQLLLTALLVGSVAGGAQSAPPLQTPPAAPPEVSAALPAARLQGSAGLRFMGMAIYNARLWVGAAAVPQAGDWSGVAFAIELDYARALWGSMIAERSLTEMRRQGDIAADVAERWLGTMKALFPDVRAGDRLTGVHTPGQGARFFLNGAPRGTPQDETFSRVFFGIWLSPKTSEPALRSALLAPAP